MAQFAADLRLLREKAGNPGYRDLARRAHYSATTLSEAAGGKRLPTLAVTLAYVQACGGNRSEWETRWHATATELSSGSAVGVSVAADDEREVPYAGLTAFQPEDAERFFGRERLTDDLVSRVRQQRFLAVFGASGAGKSSLLQAGLLPAVRSGDAAGFPWPTVLFSPGRHPLEECAAQIAHLLGGSARQLHEEFREDARGLHLAALQALADRPPDVDLLLVVDQFEEVFTLCQDPDERVRFIALLLAAAQAENSRTRVVLGVRADFYARCSDHPELVAALRDAHLLVGPMTSQELRCAITKPAISVGCTVEAALLAQITADAAGQANVLPLVSHALRETWMRRRGNTLTLAGYEASGGIHNALARTAEAAFSGLSAQQQSVARDIFVRLVALGDGTEDTKRRISLAELDTTDADVQLVLDALAQARLLVLDVGTVEITHEALIRCWPRLRGWLDDDRAGLRAHRQLTEATSAWESLHHDNSTLYRGTRLAATREWVDRAQPNLTSREQAFLTASINAERNEQAFVEASIAVLTRQQRAVQRHARRLRWVVFGLTALLVVTATAAVLAYTRGPGTAARRLNAEPEGVAPSGGAAIRRSLDDYHAQATVEARGRLLSAGAVTHRLDQLPQQDPLNTMVVDSHGRLIVASSARAMAVPHVSVWDATSRARIADLDLADTQVSGMALSPDGRMLAVADLRGQVRIWDIAQQRAVTTLYGELYGRIHLAYSPDGRRLAGGAFNGTVVVWDLERGGESITQYSPDVGWVPVVAFTPGARYLVAAGRDGMEAREALRYTRTGFYEHMATPLDAALFSPDGRFLATVEDRTITLWDTATRTRWATLSGPTGRIHSMVWNPDAKALVTASDDGTITTWNTDAEHVVEQLCDTLAREHPAEAQPPPAACPR